MVKCRLWINQKVLEKNNTRQYNLKFKNRVYFMVTLTNAIREFLKNIFSRFQLYARAYVRIWTLRPCNEMRWLEQPIKSSDKSIHVTRHERLVFGCVHVSVQRRRILVGIESERLEFMPPS